MKERKKIKQAIVVEGKYDKIKLLSIVDTYVIETNGFRIFSDLKKLNLIRNLAMIRGIIILTDSDSAGFMIRNYLKGSINKGEVLNAYIPDIWGKEKRKSEYSKEGKLGVEGVPDDVIMKSLLSANVEISEDRNQIGRKITNLDMYEFGLSGKPESSIRRKKLLSLLELPEHISSKSLVEVLNIIMDFEKFEDIVKSVNVY